MVQSKNSSNLDLCQVDKSHSQDDEAISFTPPHLSTEIVFVTESLSLECLAVSISKSLLCDSIFELSKQDENT